MIGRLALCLTLAPATAGAFDLALPLDCTLGETCFIQQFPDHDPGPAARDFTCGSMTYDGHDGTDFALVSDAAMAAGVTVRAAADGVVRGMRDGMADLRISDPAAPALNGQDCGNGIAITHAHGWETQYCHLKRGSVQVAAGQKVQAGQALGQVGLSGNTEFPHLHLTVRRNGRPVDPFAPDAPACGPRAKGLWQAPLPYVAGGIVSAGFAPEIPEFDAVRAGTAPPASDTAPALVFWAQLYGTRKGDRLTLRLFGPEGALVEESFTLDRPQARAFRAIGRKLRDASWPPGTYHGTARLMRDGAEIDRVVSKVTLP